MNVASLDFSVLAARLRKEGIWMQTGPFVFHLQSAIDEVARGIGLLYADYPLCSDNRFADFHVSVTRPATLRRWLRPQALFQFDGTDTFKPLPLDQAFPLLEWGMNWCISAHAHQFLIIHAAVLEKDGGAVILPAPPGSGKSTLCAALVHSGWRLLSDELALVRLHDARIAPAPRPVSLKNRSIEVIRQFAPHVQFSRAVSDTVKGTVAHMKPPAESVNRAQETARPAWVVFPKYEPDAEAQMTPVPRAQAFIEVAQNAFNYSLLGLPGFDALNRLIDASRCYDFTYSRLSDAVSAFAALRDVEALA